MEREVLREDWNMKHVLARMRNWERGPRTGLVGAVRMGGRE